jgi:hypothetical protein
VSNKCLPFDEKFTQEIFLLPDTHPTFAQTPAPSSLLLGVSIRQCYTFTSSIGSPCRAMRCDVCSSSSDILSSATLGDDDFDQMLSEMTAADPQLPVDDPTKTANSSSSSNSTGKSTLAVARRRHYRMQPFWKRRLSLRAKWQRHSASSVKRRGVRVRTGEPL